MAAVCKFPFFAFVRRGVAALCILAGLAPADGNAEPTGAPMGLDSRPFTLEFMLNDVSRHILEKRGEFIEQQAELQKPSGRGVLERQVQKLARGNDALENEFFSQSQAMEIIDRIGQTNDRYDFYRGAELGELVSNYIHDIQKIIGRLFSCMKLQLRAVCMKLELPGGWFPVPIPEFSLMVRYSFPTMKIEVVDQPLKTGYIPEFLIELPKFGIRELTERLFYPAIPMMTGLGIGRAQLSAQSLGALFGGAPQATPPADPTLQGKGLALGLSSLDSFEKNAAALIGASESKLRWGTRQSRTAGFRNVEYHLMPEFFNVTVGAAPPWCHRIKSPWWFSDWPLMIIPARFAGMSMILWPSTMIPLTFLPQACTFKNATSGKTPWDLAFPLAFPDPMNIMPGKAGCQGTNAGPWLPVTNTVLSLHQTDAARVGVKKAIEVSQKLLGSSTYSFSKGEGDKYQWTRSDRMPGGCGDLEKWKLDEKKTANVKKVRDQWDVALTWTRFQCCLGWRGKTESDSLGPAGGIWTIPPAQNFRFD